MCKVIEFSSRTSGRPATQGPTSERRGTLLTFPAPETRPAPSPTRTEPEPAPCELSEDHSATALATCAVTFFSFCGAILLRESLKAGS